MLEQLKKYWAKICERPLLKHFLIIVVVLLVLGISAHLLRCCWARATAHSARCPT